MLSRFPVQRALLLRPSQRTQSLIKPEFKCTEQALSLSRLTTPQVLPEQFRVRARVAFHRATKRAVFIVLQQGFVRVQCFITDQSPPTDGPTLKDVAKDITVGSIIDVVGRCVSTENPINSASNAWKLTEIVATDLKVISTADRLPLTAANSASSIAADCALRSSTTATLTRICSSNASSDAPAADAQAHAASEGAKLDPTSVRLDTRLDHRVVDVRAPEAAAAIELSSVAERAFCDYCVSKELTAIRTPKLLGGASEGGSDVFQTNYFGATATLAQSPQLSKQMALMGDVGGGRGVFEVGPVFRAEKSSTHRHLCEFTSLDVELGIDHCVEEVVAFAEGAFVACIEAMKAKEGDLGWQSPPMRMTLQPEVAERVRTHMADATATNTIPQYSFNDENASKDGAQGPHVLRLSFPYAAELISAAVDRMGASDAAALGVTVQSPMKDLTSANERLLGAIVAQQFQVDAFSVMRFPAAVRAFYSMPCNDPRLLGYSESFDFFVRGEEACSGAQRVHIPSLLMEILEARGMDATPLKAYVDAFRFGAWPHGGFAIGLERLVALYMGLNNVRNAVLFPRDPRRLAP